METDCDDYSRTENPELRRENNRYNRDLCYESSWLFKIFRDYRLSKKEKSEVLKSYKVSK